MIMHQQQKENDRLDKILVVMSGIPGSGKTFLRDQILNYLYAYNCATMQETDDGYTSALVASSDDRLDSYAHSQGITYDQAWTKYNKLAEKVYWATLETGIADNFDVVFADRTHVSEASRKRTIDTVKATPGGEKYQIICVDVSCKPKALELRHKRREAGGKTIPPAVMKSMMEGKTSPMDDKMLYHDVFMVNEDNFDDMMKEIVEYIISYTMKHPVY